MSPERPANAKDRLRELLRKRSYREQVVTLASGKTSDWFIDCKQTALSAEGHVLVGELMLAELRRLAPDAVAVCGVALGGCSLASSVSYASFATPSDKALGAAVDAIYVRKTQKDHGSRRNMEGNDGVKSGAEVVVLEDVVTTGGSTLNAVEIIRETYQVNQVIALVDREEGGVARLQEEGLTLTALFTRASFRSPETNA